MTSNATSDVPLNPTLVKGVLVDYGELLTNPTFNTEDLIESIAREMASTVYNISVNGIEIKEGSDVEINGLSRIKYSFNVDRFGYKRKDGESGPYKDVYIDDCYALLSGTTYSYKTLAFELFYAFLGKKATLTVREDDVVLGPEDLLPGIRRVLVSIALSQSNNMNFTHRKRPIPVVTQLVVPQLTPPSHVEKVLPVLPSHVKKDGLRIKIKLPPLIEDVKNPDDAEKLDKSKEKWSTRGAEEVIEGVMIYSCIKNNWCTEIANDSVLKLDGKRSEAISKKWSRMKPGKPFKEPISPDHKDLFLILYNVAQTYRMKMKSEKKKEKKGDLTGWIEALHADSAFKKFFDEKSVANTALAKSLLRVSLRDKDPIIATTDNALTSIGGDGAEPAAKGQDSGDGAAKGQDSGDDDEPSAKRQDNKSSPPKVCQDNKDTPPNV